MTETVEKAQVFATCAVKGLVLYEDQFLVLSKPRWVLEMGLTWNDLPGGRIDFGEGSPQEALLRELREEIGCDAIEVIRPIHMTTVVQTGDFHVVATVFLCRASSKEVKLSQEHAGYCWLNCFQPEYPLPTWIEGALAALPKEHLWTV